MATFRNVNRYEDPKVVAHDGHSVMVDRRLTDTRLVDPEVELFVVYCQHDTHRGVYWEAFREELADLEPHEVPIIGSGRRPVCGDDPCRHIPPHVTLDDDLAANPGDYTQEG